MNLYTIYYLAVGFVLVGLIFLFVLKGRKAKPIKVPQPQAVPVARQEENTSRLVRLSSKPVVKAEPVVEVKAELQTKNAPESPIIEKVTTDLPLNAVILDDTTRSFGERHIDLIPGKDYGRQVLYLNSWVFYLHRFANGIIEPVPGPTHENLEHSPGETYEAVKNEEDTKTVFGKRNQGNGMKIWWLILGTIAILFIAWMAYNSKGAK